MQTLFAQKDRQKLDEYRGKLAQYAPEQNKITTYLRNSVRFPFYCFCFSTLGVKSKPFNVQAHASVPHLVVVVVLIVAVGVIVVVMGVVIVVVVMVMVVIVVVVIVVMVVGVMVVVV